MRKADAAILKPGGLGLHSLQDPSHPKEYVSQGRQMETIKNQNLFRRVFGTLDGLPHCLRATAFGLLGLPGASSLQSDAQSVSQADTSGAFFIAGNSRDPDGFCPVLWSAEAGGAFAGPLDLDGPALNMQAAVNDTGTVVTASGQVFVLGLEMQELPKLNAVDAHASAINNNDEIVGWIIYDDGSTREVKGALWALDEDGVPGDPLILDDLYPAGVSFFLPMDISDTGVMAGEVQDFSIAAIARIEGSELQIDPLGVLPGFDWSGADAISSDGTWVAGTCRRDGPWQAFLWSADDGMIDLGSLADRNSYAYDVNNAGQVVGMSDLPYGGRYSQAAVLWENGLVFDLNTLVDAGSKIHLPLAKGINNAGNIVGLMHISRPISESHGCLLIPNEQ